MGGIIGFIVCVCSAILLYGFGHSFLFWAAIVISAADLWSWGIMHNYAMNAAKARFDRLRENLLFENRPPEDLKHLDDIPIQITPRDANLVPNWITSLNMLFTIIGFCLLILAIILRFVI